MLDTPIESELFSIITTQIKAAPGQRISFAEYMGLALYEPEQGYYDRSHDVLGPKGDFITSIHMGPDFGELLAEQLAEMWQWLGQPSPFDIVEIGPGQGLLAATVLGYLQSHYPDCFEVLKYTLVERSSALQAEQRKRLRAWLSRTHWKTLDEIAGESITGCVFSNEWVDALPVHVVERQGEALLEVYVAVDEQQTDDGAGDAPVPAFCEVLGPLSTSKVLEHFDELGIDLLSGQYPEGYRTEVNLAVLEAWVEIATRLHRGYLLTIDYGYPAHRYYNPRRMGGTLQCYSQHRHHNDPYWAVGQQDITAHVNFTALEKQGEAIGLKNLGFTQQAMFLMALGLGERMAALSQAQVKNNQEMQALLQRRESLRQLIDPMGLGNFGVLVQAKGLSESVLAKPLKGLTVPPLV